MIRFETDKNLLGAIPSPLVALKAAPDYFKKIKPQIGSNPESGTVKRCVPFLDALSSGYVIPLWADMFVTANNGEITINFPSNYAGGETLSEHSYAQIEGHPLASKAYGQLALKFINPWIVSTDDGVSCLFTSPLNHMETRFKILDGVVDTDTYYNNVNFPFLWTGGDGEFFIPRGTPLVQVIPFRREEHEASFGVIDVDRRAIVASTLGTRMKNAYREEYWHNRKNAEADGE